MKPRILLVGLVGLSTLTAAHASLKSEIEAFNKLIKAALVKRDVAQFKKLDRTHVAPDFEYADGDTTMNFDQMVGRVRQEYAVFTKMTAVSIQVLSTKEQGATGTAVEKRTRAGTVKGRDGKLHKTAIVVITYETYRRINGGWKMVRSASNTETVTVDGKTTVTGGAKVPQKRIGNPRTGTP